MYHRGSDNYFHLPIQDVSDGQCHTTSTMGIPATDRFAASAQRFIRGFSEGTHGDKPFALFVPSASFHDF